MQFCAGIGICGLYAYVEYMHENMVVELKVYILKELQSTPSFLQY